MEYQVPQFIEVEDKIFGPFTLRQFIFVAGGVGLSAAILVYVPLIFALILVLPIAGITGALAFYKVNNKSFLDIMEAGFNYYTKERLYLWKKVEKKSETPAIVQVAAPTQVDRQKLGVSSDRLKELAWSLDIKDHNKTPDTY
ncbi:MAG: hypothetical protein AB203_03865 [Parcubacteria bacterium C7867-008]|nr:MAG: hypothetical protein AB203_03865 [Parcubacteria bacterium C7867-008]